MKKIFLVSALFIVSQLLCSCGYLYSMFDDPQTGEDPYKNKTTMKSFADVEDPVVLNLPLVLIYTAFNGVKVGSTYSPSSIHLVYDWKNDTVHDWCYYHHGLYTDCTVFPNEFKYEGSHFYSYKDTNYIHTYDIFADGTCRHTENVAFGYRKIDEEDRPFCSPLQRTVYTSPYIPIIKENKYEDNTFTRNLSIFDWRTWKEVCIADNTQLEDINRYALDSDNNLYIEYVVDDHKTFPFITRYCRFDYSTKQVTQIIKEEAEPYLDSVYIEGTKISIAKDPASYTQQDEQAQINMITYTFTIDDVTQKTLSIPEVVQRDSSLLSVEKVDSALYVLLSSKRYGYLLYNLSDAPSSVTASSEKNASTANTSCVTIPYAKVPSHFEAAYFRGDYILFMIKIYETEGSIDSMYWTECYRYNIKTGDIKKTSFKLDTLL